MLSKAIDFAGIFPPAKLAMADSVDAYLRFTHGEEAWLVSRFVCSAGRLTELKAELDQHSPEEVSQRDALPIAVVGTAPPDHKHWHHSIEHDAGEMERFQRSAERRAELEAFEIRVPDHEHLEEYLRTLTGFENVDVYVEIPWAGPIADSIAIIAETSLEGVKARTGGTEASAFPTADQLAEFIRGAVQAECPFKCTAGLHEPVAHFDDRLGIMHHGFLNVLVATALAMREDLSRKEIAEILSNTFEAEFRIHEDFLQFQGARIDLNLADEARELFVSFGSCSVDEPLKGLARLAGVQA